MRIPNPAEQGEANHPDRATYLGSHSSAALLGASPYSSPVREYLRHTGQLEASAPSERMRWGLRLEGPILDGYEQQMRVTLPRRQTFWRHPKFAFIGGSTDADYGEIVVDAKATAYRTGWGEAGSADIPQHLACQGHHLMLVTGAARCDFAVLFAGQEFRIYRLERDEAFCRLLEQLLVRFWTERIIPRDPPSLDGDAHTTAYLARRYATHGPVVRAASDEEAELLADYDEAAAAAEAAQNRLNELKNRLRAAIGPDLGIEAGRLSATWKEQQGRASLDKRLLDEEAPGIVGRCTVRGPNYRVLRTRKKQET